MTALSPAQPGSFGVVLNANAGRVTRRLTEAIRRVAGPEHVFLTESKEHAEQVLRLCVERGYRAIFAGGGDGTIMDTVNTLESLRLPELPPIGVLRLGTGNALAIWLGASRPVLDLRRFLAEGAPRVVRVRMVTTDGHLHPFGGAGYDAAILNDYYRLKRRLAGGWAPWLGQGLLGYVLAGFGMTLPNHLLRRRPQATVINIGEPAWRIGPGGDELGPPIPRGEVLFRGPIAHVGAATTPQLGYGMRFFPFACRRPGRFHLRVLDFNPVQSALYFPQAWTGALQHPQLHDFYAERVRVVFNQAVPFQMGGDPAGYRDEVNFGLSDREVPFVGQA